MKLGIGVLALIACLQATAFCEEEAGVPSAPLMGTILFVQNLRIAEWIAQYDRVAWVSSDELAKAPKERRARLGPHWFCYAGKDGWHAIYGKLSADGKTYDVAFHFLVNKKFEVKELKATAISSEHLAFAHALKAAYAKVMLPTYEKYGVKLNPYARRVGKHIEVWYAPSWQQNGDIAFGQTHRLQFSQDGKKLMAHDKWDYKMRHVRPNKEIDLVIGDRTASSPSVGDIFFALYYGNQFKTVMIRSKTFTTSRIMIGEHGQWVHCVLPEKETPEEPPAKPAPEGEKPPAKDPDK
jgi:hypothetical protein